MITVYATAWCGDCKLAKHVLDEASAEYRWVDIDQVPGAADYVQKINGGLRSVPTILFPDGRVLVGPSRAELKQALAA